LGVCATIHMSERRTAHRGAREESDEKCAHDA